MCNSQQQRKWLDRITGSVLAVGVLCLCVSVLPVMAQQQSDQGTQGATAQANSEANANKSIALGKISVVGSRIPRSTVELARPVTILTSKQIEATGLTNVGEVLQHITSAGSATNSRVDVGGNGETNLDLRNLGSNRVLILVNGKRWITGLGGSVNLDQIPTSIIQSIQVLKDGASAIYGSDAIAGVVNIVTKKTFEGAQASAYLGEYNYGGKWDGQTQQYYYLMGYGNDKGNITFDIQYQQNDAVTNCARPISCVPFYGTPRGSSFGPNGRYEFYPPSGSSLYDNTTLCPPDKTGKPFCDLTTIPGTPGTSIADFTHWNSATDQYNYAQLYDLIAPNESTNLYVQGSYAFNSNVSFHSTAMYNHHINIERYSPVNLDIGAGGVGSLISATNPYNPFGIDLDSNVTAPQPGVGLLILAGLRPIAGGFRNFTATTDTYYYNGGLDGTFNWGSRAFNWNADYIFGRELEADLTPTGEFNTQRMDLALGPISNCGTGSPNPDCVPLDFFGSGGITPEMMQYVTAQEQSQTNETLRDYEFNLSSSDIADLPAGPLGFNVGYEYRQLEGDDHPDSLQQAGISTDGAEAPTGGGYTVKSLYGELAVPLLANLPLVKEMDVDLAVRASRFSTFGSNTTRQVGFRWQPNGQLLLRATWGQGYRAPNISELFEGRSQSGPFALDPCNFGQLENESAQTAANCRAAGVPPTYTQAVNGELNDAVTEGGNPHVSPENSLSKSVGFVFNPDALPGFNFNADYFKIEVDNLISTFGAQNILNACYIGGAAQFCDLISRNSQGILLNINDTENNIGNLLTEGVDVGASYAFTTSVGAFNVKFQSTFTKEYEQVIPSATGGAPQVWQLRGWELGQNYEGYPKNKSILSVNWNLGNWSALWRLRYISSMIEDCTGFVVYGVCSDPKSDHLSYNGASMIPTNHLGATTYEDASVSYALDALNSSLSLGINNLFNKEPPISYSAHNLSFDPTMYDIPGRFVYFRVTTKF